MCFALFSLVVYIVMRFHNILLNCYFVFLLHFNVWCCYHRFAPSLHHAGEYAAKVITQYCAQTISTINYSLSQLPYIHVFTYDIRIAFSVSDESIICCYGGYYLYIYCVLYLLLLLLLCYNVT